MIKAEHVVPKPPSLRQEMMVVGMIQEPLRPVSAQWIDWIGRVFEEFKAEPLFGGGSVGNKPNKKRSAGNYRRVKNKFHQLFEEKTLTDDWALANFGTAPKGDSLVGENERMHVSVNKTRIISHEPRTSAYWSIRTPLACDPLEVFERMAVDLIQTFQPLYGFLTLYPAAWDWSCPAWGTAYVPHDWEDRDPDNRIYQQRVFRAPNDREWRFRPEKGWMREVYTVNLINDRHLAAPFGGRTLGDYITSNGELRRNLEGSQLHLWHVPDNIIDCVRNELEHSGLILASETEPIALPA